MAPIEIVVDATEPWPTVINFGFDESHTVGAQHQKLMSAAMILKQNPSLNVAVIGSADSSGQNAYNDVLAKKELNILLMLLSNKEFLLLVLSL